MAEDLYQIIYISSANAALTENALLELLAISRKRNAARHITGLLLHADGSIIQVLEGPNSKLQGLYQKIAADSRHRGITLMSNRPIKQRDFPEFKMGFKRARSQEIKEQLPGFTDVVERRDVSKEQLAGLSKLVAVFIRTFAHATNIERFDS